MFDMSELVEVTFLRRSASASRLPWSAPPAYGTPAVVAETASTTAAHCVFFGPSVSTSLNFKISDSNQPFLKMRLS